MSEYEKKIATREGEEIHAEDAYFEARPQADTHHNRHIFKEGFNRGFDVLYDRAPQQPQPAMTQERAKAAYLLTHSVGIPTAQPAALEGLQAAMREAIDYCESAEWSNAVEVLRCALVNPSPATVSAGAVPEVKADMFWDRDNPERNYDSIDELVNHAWEQGAEIGCEFTVQQAASLPDARVRLLWSGNGPDDVDGETTYELLSAAQSQGDANAHLNG